MRAGSSAPRQERPKNGDLIRKIAWTALAGFVTFAGSALLEDLLDVTRADQLILTAIAGGMAFLVQYLSDLEGRLGESEDHTQSALEEIHSALRKGFTEVSEATDLMAELERSALATESLKRMVRRTGLITATTAPLARGLADSEIERLSETLQSLADGHEIFYDGEDREFLLALTRRVSKSIKATSWATVSAHGVGFEAGFWLNDLGGRYLDLQRTALRRGVKIQRVFIFESPDLIHTPELRRILTMQQNAGVEVKVRSGPIPSGGSITDLVLFDDEISYDTTPLTRGDMSVTPWLLNTRLVLKEDMVRNRIVRFAELWEDATYLDGGSPALAPASP
jgi:hypothetical protein